MIRNALGTLCAALLGLAAMPSVARAGPATCSNPPPDLLIQDAQPFAGNELERQLARALLPRSGHTLYLADLPGRGPEAGVYLTRARGSCQVVKVWIQGGSFRLAVREGARLPKAQSLRAPLGMETCRQLLATWSAVLSTRTPAPAPSSLPPCWVVMDGGTYHLGVRDAGGWKFAHAEPQHDRPKLDAFVGLARDLARFVYVRPAERATKEAALRRSATEVAAAFGEAPAPGR
ncbi:MAG: hypothetical protein QM704_08930 [Anaeromyxobacteraceae bacterium]